MIATVNDYGDFKTLWNAFPTLPVSVYYFDGTAGGGTFNVYGIYWAGGVAFQVALSAKPATLATDFHGGAVALKDTMVLS